MGTGHILSFGLMHTIHYFNTMKKRFFRAKQTKWEASNSL